MTSGTQPAPANEKLTRSAQDRGIKKKQELPQDAAILAFFHFVHPWTPSMIPIREGLFLDERSPECYVIRR